MPGKTPMWGNPTRDRERSYYSASRKYITTTKSHFQPREIPHSTKRSPNNFLPWKTCPNLYSCTTSFNFVPQKPCPTECCMTCKVWLNKTKETPKSWLDLCAKRVPRKSFPLLLYGLYGSVQYDPTQKK
jgi:hypothetical protein